MEDRTPTKRRFGSEAHALWTEFRGDLTDADRIELMLRDADAQWPGAFGARTVFGLAGVAEDEPFGPDWESLDAVDAAVQLAPFDVPPIGAAARFVVAGPSAIAALARGFAEGRDLDWADQVVSIATPPAHRQIAAVAGGLLNVSKRARVVFASEPLEIKPGAKLITSPDAQSDDVARAQALTSRK
jgi:hypothetical protein